MSARRTSHAADRQRRRLLSARRRSVVRGPPGVAQARQEAATARSSPTSSSTSRASAPPDLPPSGGGAGLHWRHHFQSHTHRPLRRADTSLMPSALPAAARRALKPLPDLDGRTRRAWTAHACGDRKGGPPDRRPVPGGRAWRLRRFATVTPDAFSNALYLYGIAACALLFGCTCGSRSTSASSRSIGRSRPRSCSSRHLLHRPADEPAPDALPLAADPQRAVRAAGRLATNLVLSLITFGFSFATVADSESHKASFVIFSIVVVGVTVAYRRLRSTVAELFIRLEELSSRDPLTGALSQEAFERALRAWSAMACAAGGDLARRAGGRRHGWRDQGAMARRWAMPPCSTWRAGLRLHPRDRCLRATRG